jgi:chemotaxis protein MotB
MARKKKGHAGGHGWFVTFADLMALLMSFFVMVAAYSTSDKQKMQALMGSMREAFGNTRETRLGGVIEISGFPTRNQFTATSPVPNDHVEFTAEQDRDLYRAPGRHSQGREGAPGPTSRDQRFGFAAATLRQAWQELPEVAALSQNVQVEETPDGLMIRLVDQDHRAMFPEGSRFPFERTRIVLQSLGPVLARLPNRITVTGHTPSRPLTGRPGYTNWDLSSDRANSVRQILMEGGVRGDRFAAVSGKADTDPVFPQDPAAISNGRVTILLMPDAPPVPPRLTR